jgi:uroporphyrinogen decarboxylase
LTSRERILLALQDKEADRVAIHDSPWFTTIRRWHKEGLAEDVDPYDYFEYEFADVGARTTFRLPEQVLEETDDYRITTNFWGSTVKNWKNATSTPETIAFGVNSAAEWAEKKHLMLDWDDERIDWGRTRASYDKARAAGKFITFGEAMGYDRTQGIVGSERLLIAMAEEPEWVKDMFDANAEITVRSMEEMLAGGIDFDGAFFYDDMGYRNASLFSPRMFRELSMPAHKRVCDFAHSRGKPTILHSCGCVKELIPSLIETGYDCLQPLEVKAGMDLVELKKRYGEKMAFMGGIDVRKMSNPDPNVIEEEIATKIGFAKRGGGYIYHSDHSVPDDISFPQYCRVIDLVKKYGSYE